MGKYENSCSSIFFFYLSVHYPWNQWIECIISVVMGRDAERTLIIRNSERFGLLKQNCMGLNRSLPAREFLRFSKRFCIPRVRFSEVGLYLTRYPKLCICDNNTALRLPSDNRKSCNFNGEKLCHAVWILHALNRWLWLSSLIIRTWIRN